PVNLESMMISATPSPCDALPFGSCPAYVKAPVLISVVLDDNGTPNQYPGGGNTIHLTRGFAAWQGTSFSAALMSGWSALQLASVPNPYNPITWTRMGPHGLVQISS